MVPPGLEFFALFFALFKAGIVPVLIDPGIGLKPLKQCLDEAEPEAFIGITRAQLARVLLRWSPKSIRRSVTLGPRLAWGGITLRGLARRGGETGAPVLAGTRGDDMAAILFTSGSTGIPKGVVYRHRHFVAQVEMLRDTFGIRPGEVDLATFPPFALFDPALGMTTVVPHMDPTRPAQANPEYLVQAIEQFGVTNLFGSPALLKVLGRYCTQESLVLPTLKRVLVRRRGGAGGDCRDDAAGHGEPGGCPYALWRHRVPAGRQHLQRGAERGTGGRHPRRTRHLRRPPGGARTG